MLALTSAFILSATGSVVGRVSASGVKTHAALLTFTAAASSTGQTRVCMAFDPGHSVRLIPHTRRGEYQLSATWSPNGRYFAFAGTAKDDGADSDILVATAGGKVIRNLSPRFAQVNNFPVWSPNGRWIAFIAGTEGEGKWIAVVSPSGYGLDGKRGPTDVWRPGNMRGPDNVQWSPDSEHLFFSERRSMASGTYSIGLNGSDLHLVLKGALLPAVSPRGSLLAYVRLNQEEIYVARLDGSHERRLTKTRRVIETHPAWAPSGRWIAFERVSGSGDVANPFRTKIVVTRSDGSKSRVAVESRKYDAVLPSWRPAVSLPKGKRASC